MAARRARLRLTRHRLDPLRAASLLRELMPVGGDDKPAEVLGWRDGRGRIRRVCADYPNGWRLRIGFSARGDITSRSASLHLADARPV